MKKILAYIVIILVFLGAAFGGGYFYRYKTYSCTNTIDTLYHYDTIPHIIYDSFPYYVQSDPIVIHDTIPRIIDTAKILEDYFALHVYERKWEDDTLKVVLKDTITQNTPYRNAFSYNIKVPFTTIINKNETNILNNRGIYAGVDIPIKDFRYLEIEAIYAGPKMYFGVGYEPQLKCLNLKAGIKITSFANKNK